MSESDGNKMRLSTAEMDLMQLLSKREDLHPNLVPFLSESTGGWAMLRHPLVYSVPHHEQQNAYVNAQYHAKLRAIKEAHEKAEWDHYLILHERPYRVGVFMQIKSVLQAKAYWETVSWLWSDSENIHQNRRQWRQIWLSKEPERQAVMDEEELGLFAELPDVLKIYRGIRYQSAVRGLSWTLDRDKAVWFAKRFRLDRQPILLTTEIQKSQAIAYLIGRNESEIVVHPKAPSKLIITQEKIIT